VQPALPAAFWTLLVSCLFPLALVALLVAFGAALVVVAASVLFFLSL